MQQRGQSISRYVVCGIPIVALMADGEPKSDGTCLSCGAPVRIGFEIVEMARRWNLEEREAAQFENRVPQYLKLGDLICCDECIPLHRKRLDSDALLERTTTEIYLRDLFAGRYNPNTLRWLREHNHRKDVDRVLNEEGVKK